MMPRRGSPIVTTFRIATHAKHCFLSSSSVKFSILEEILKNESATRRIRAFHLAPDDIWNQAQQKPYATVCDLYSGAGVDIDKWDEAQIGHYIGIDVSTSGIVEAKEKWESERKPYTAYFGEFDPSLENLGSLLEDKGTPADIVCCLQHLQLCFQAEDKARSFLYNVSAMLRPGGYFFGITPDSSTIWAKYQKNVEASHNRAGGMKPNSFPHCIRTESYMITFEVEEEKFPLFGKKYLLKFASDPAPESHCLVHFPSLIRLAREAGLDFVEIQNLTEFYDDNRAQFSGMLQNAGPAFVDPRGRLLPRCLDILGLYTTFIFQKSDPDSIPPMMTPAAEDGGHDYEEDIQGSGWSRNQATVADEEMNGHVEPTIVVIPDLSKGILGPGPADLRFSEPM